MMHIKIYQIDAKRDCQNAMFQNLDDLERCTGSRELDSTIYNRVYDGEVACFDLEDVYRMFNLRHPADFFGHSLSVSDVVEVVGRDGASTFHFCDSIGFKKTAFQPEKAHVPAAIRVLLLEPGKPARMTDIDASLRGMQRVVGGRIEATYPFTDEVCLIVNEEGKLDGLPLNRAIRSEDGEILDIAAGTCFLCGCGGESFSSLSAEQAEKYGRRFRYPERFFRTADGIAAIPYRPQKEERVR